MKTLITFIIGFFMSAGLAMAQDFEYSFSESYKVSSPVTLKIQTSDGNIEVKPSSGNEIKVYYIARKENRILKISREELEKEVTLIVNHSDNSLEITVQHDQRSSWFGINQVEVGFKILAPAQTAGTLRTSDGNISVDGLVSAQDCKTSDGNITVSNIKGQLSGVTSDGNVNMSGITGAVTARSSDGNISLEKISGNIQATTSDGNISLNTINGDVQSVTSDGSIKLNSVTGDASARTSDGHISFEDFSGSLTATTSDGNISGNIVKLVNKLSARTSGGNVDITIPDKLGIDLDVRGESLNVPLNNFSGKSDEKSIHGQSNGGGISVTLEASDGNVNLAFR